MKPSNLIAWINKWAILPTTGAPWSIWVSLHRHNRYLEGARGGFHSLKYKLRRPLDDWEPLDRIMTPKDGILAHAANRSNTHGWGSVNWVFSEGSGCHFSRSLFFFSSYLKQVLISSVGGEWGTISSIPSAFTSFFAFQTQAMGTPASRDRRGRGSEGTCRGKKKRKKKCQGGLELEICYKWEKGRIAFSFHIKRFSFLAVMCGL